MSDVVVGGLALLLGLLLCFRGSGALRILLALWGAFIGFGVGAVAVVQLTGQEYLGTVAGWAGAIIGPGVRGARLPVLRRRCDPRVRGDGLRPGTDTRRRHRR